MHAHIPPLLVVLVAAVLAPLIAEATRRWGVSVVVLEILLGVAIGPQGLGWAAPDHGGIPYLATIGMAALFFLAGLEIDLHGIQGQPIKRAGLEWLGAFALACGLALGMRAAGMIEAWLVVAIALVTTALGVLVPMLKDAELLESPFGRRVMAAGVMGELGPILAMSLLLSTRHTADVQTGFTLAFIAVVLAVGWVLLRGNRVPAVLGLLTRTLTRSSQLPVRIAMLLVVAFAVLAENMGLDLALGALAAGMTVGLATRDAKTDLLHQKVEAVGFGFLVPIFFVTSGMKLDVAAIFAGAEGLGLMAVFFVAVLAVRIVFALLPGNIPDIRRRAALGLYSATTLPLVVALVNIGVEGGLMTPAEAAPLIGGAMLTVLLFPLMAMSLTGHAEARRGWKYHDRAGL